MASRMAAKTVAPVTASTTAMRVTTRRRRKITDHDLVTANCTVNIFAKDSGPVMRMAIGVTKRTADT